MPPKYEIGEFAWIEDTFPAVVVGVTTISEAYEDYDYTIVAIISDRMLTKKRDDEPLTDELAHAFAPFLPLPPAIEPESEVTA